MGALIVRIVDLLAREEQQEARFGGASHGVSRAGSLPRPSFRPEPRSALPSKTWRASSVATA
jgi:hypothetical protein